MSIELNEEKSKVEAVFIRLISGMAAQLDVDYCRQAAKAMLEQVSFQESISVLSPAHPVLKNEILRTKANALKHLCDFANAIREVEKLRAELSEYEKQQSKINELFI